jgi:hypothetical protein
MLSQHGCLVTPEKGNEVRATNNLRRLQKENSEQVMGCWHRKQRSSVSVGATTMKEEEE